MGASGHFASRSLTLNVHARRFVPGSVNLSYWSLNPRLIRYESLRRNFPARTRIAGNHPATALRSPTRICATTRSAWRALSLSVGIEPKERIALLLNDSPEFIEAFIAICSMGAIAVPINTALRLGEQRAIIHNCRARLAIVESEFLTPLLTDAPEELHLPQDIDRNITTLSTRTQTNPPPITLK